MKAELTAEPQHERGVQVDEKQNPATNAYMKPAGIAAAGLVLGFIAVIVVFFLQSPSPTPPRLTAANAIVLKDVADAYVKGDYATALRLLRPVADQGDASAQYFLGLMYQRGNGVPQDYTAAVKWYRKAADQGYALAQNNLGFLYVNGTGVPQNYAEALKWYRPAADQGLALAQYNLGIMYENGDGVPVDHVSAYMWFSLAAAQGLQEATKNRNVMAHQMTPAEIAQAQKRALAAAPPTSQAVSQNKARAQEQKRALTVAPSTSENTSQYTEPMRIDELPSFDVEVYCRKLATFNLKTLEYDGEFSLSAFGQCKSMEQISYDQLSGKMESTSSWDKLPAAVRLHCLKEIKEVSVGVMPPSYLKLSGCVSSAMKGTEPFRR